MDVILLKYPETICFGDIDHYLKYLTVPRQNGILKKKNDSSKVNALLSRLLLLWELEQRTGIPQSKIEFVRGTHGKPYLKHSDLQFSLSHTKGAVCVAFSDKGEIGVDVESAARRVRPELYKNVLCEEELAALDNSSFLSFWVRKEAFLKRLGLGITQDLRGVNTFLIPNTAALQCKGYYVGISAEESPTMNITTISLPELIGKYND